MIFVFQTQHKLLHYSLQDQGIWYGLILHGEANITMTHYLNAIIPYGQK